MDYQEKIIHHYETKWKSKANIHYWEKGRSNELPYDFRILEFSPSKSRDMWTYATCCMSQESDLSKVELHIFSSKQDHSLIELLTAIAHYNRTGHSLGLNHTVNFGRPWQDNSKCEYGFISLPYLDGPDLENLPLNKNEAPIKCFWLIPICKEEVEYSKKRGAQLLEQLFEDSKLDYLSPNRNNLCEKL